MGCSCSSDKEIKERAHHQYDRPQQARQQPRVGAGGGDPLGILGNNRVNHRVNQRKADDFEARFQNRRQAAAEGRRLRAPPAAAVGRYQRGDLRQIVHAAAGRAQPPQVAGGAPPPPKVAVNQPCMICDVDFGSRFHCSQGHVICKTCFHNQVSAWSDMTTGDCGDVEKLIARLDPAARACSRVDQLDKVKMNKFLGEVPCTQYGCKVHIKVHEVTCAINTDLALLEKYKAACKLQAEKVDMARAKLAGPGSPRTPIPPLASRERSAREIFMEEELLTLHCPKCSMAVVDFTDCFAVQCASCRSWFCAWCLNFHGTCQEAHDHVPKCSENQSPDKSVWSTLELFTAYHKKRRLSQCVDFLKGEADPSLQNRVRPLLQGALGKDAWREVEAKTTAKTKAAPVAQQRKVALARPGAPRWCN